MSSKTLGPQGCLPPDGWTVGARVSVINPGWVIAGIDHDEPDGLWICDPLEAGPDYSGVAHVYRDECHLDLATGSLDFGTRALLSLLSPSVEQPLTAPSWELFHRQWTLTMRHGDGWEAKWRFTDHGVYHGYDRIMDTPEAMLNEKNPRRALARALEALWAKKKDK